ncbi:MAG: serine/threonine protein kinase [Verrucomicrobiaceae bacterium]|nr:serine/threonine protein kinase [Verrucomicrobiaceae bacterium]
MSPEEQPTILTPPPNGSRPAPVGWQAPSVEEMQAMLPQYEVLEILGRGGMGAVYKARQKSLKRLVAIKILPLGMADDEFKFAERFQNEAQTMAAMNHPAIVSVYDFGETPDGLLYFIMEFVDGTDVQKMIQGSGRLSGEHALAITAHVCDALAYAHKRGVIHRDIKPANILIDQEGHIKVADFGLAKMHDPAQTSGLTRTGTAMGTPDYVAPEVLSPGMVADHRADLYAVGVMLYQMLTGEVPRGMFKLPSQKGIGSDVRFDEIICKAMEQDREERYQSATEVRHALDVILTTPQPKDDGTGIVSATQIPQKPTPQRAPAQKADAAPKAKAPPKKQSPAKMWLSIGGIVAVLGAAGFLLLGGKPKPQASLTTDTASVTVPPTQPQPPNKVGENSNPSAPVSSASPKGKEIDLLALVDLKRDVVAGDWERTPDGLVKKGIGTTSEGVPRLQLPYQPPEEYDFEIEFTPTTGTQSLGQMIAAQSRMFSWIINGGRTSEPMIGFEMFESKATSTPSEVSKHMDGELVNGRRYRSRVEVRAGSLRGFLDDKEIVNWSGKLQRLALDPPSRLRDDGHLGIRAVRQTTFHKITVREITGTGRVDAGTATTSSVSAKTIDLLALVDPSRDAVVGKWSQSANGLSVAAGDQTTAGKESLRLQLPYQPPEEYDFEIEFTASAATGRTLGQILSASARNFSLLWGAGAESQPLAGFEVLDGLTIGRQTTTTKPLPGGIESGRRYRSRVEVRRDLMRAFLDDKEVVSWKGSFKSLSIDEQTRLRDELHLGLRTSRPVTYHKITVREVSGAGKVDEGTAVDASAWTDWLGPKLAAGDFAANGWVRSSNGVTTQREISGLRLLPPGTKNAAVRVTYVLQDSQGLMLNARERMEGKVRLGYCVIDKVNQLHLNRLKPDGRSAALQHVILPAEPDRMAERTLELRMIGNQLNATLNGTFAGTATDDTLSEGEWTLVFMKGVLVKKVELQPLDAAP